jgi:hypothetical protein
MYSKLYDRILSSNDTGKVMATSVMNGMYIFSAQNSLLYHA